MISSVSTMLGRWSKFGDRAFRRIPTIAPDRPIPLFFLIWVDAIVVNLVFFQLTKSLVFYGIGYASVFGILGASLAFLAVTGLFHGLNPWGREPSTGRWLGEVLPFAVFAVFVTALSNIETSQKGIDGSWLRPEMVKTPLWLKLFVPLSPWYMWLCVALVSVIIWKAIRNPRSWMIRLLALGAVFFLILKIIVVLAPSAGSPLTPTDSWFRTKLYPFYIAYFAGPSILFAILLWRHRFSLAFRTVPLAFHMSLIAFNYLGALPVQSIYDVIPIKAEAGFETKIIPGVTMIYPPPGANADGSFVFLRKMLLTPTKIFVNYGPTCGLYSIDRSSRFTRRIDLDGLMRDLQPARNGQSMMGLNWMTGDFIAIDMENLEVQCRKDLFPDKLTTPWLFARHEDRLFISNVTPPIVAEYGWPDPEKPCGMYKKHSLDFHEIGFTPFTDGVYGIHVEPEWSRLYAVVGLLEDRFILALVEIDLETFKPLRDIRLRAGTAVFPINGRKSLLVPSYYTSELHEIDLTSMTLVRTIHTDPNIVSLVHDTRRGLFYAVARASGHLQVISDREGRVLRTIPIGTKPEPLALDENTDQLYVGSSLGIIEIDLPKFLGEGMGAGGDFGTAVGPVEVKKPPIQ